MREIIVDRENGAKAFVLFELTKGNIAEIKDRYILEQLRSAIDSPWSTALPDGIRSALTRSVSEEMSHISRYMMCRSQTSRNVWPGV